MKKAMIAFVVAAAALIAIFAMSTPASAGEVEVPACEATSVADGDDTYGSIVDGVWTASAAPPCVRCVGGQRPPGAPVYEPCCP